jgi:biotin operon repressor
LRSGWNRPNLPAFVQARPAAMVAIHSDAELEALKALLIAGHSQSEIGVWLGMRRPVLQGLVQRLKRQGVAVPRSRSGPKPVTIMPAEAGADRRIRAARCHRRTIARSGRQCLPMACGWRRSRHAVLRRGSRWACIVLSAACGAQCGGRGAGSVRQGAVDGAGNRV